MRQEPLVWAAARGRSPELNTPVPLALFGPGCIYRDAAMKAMDGTGRPYRLAYSSANPSGLSAAVEAGLAVTTAVQSTLSSRLRVLGEVEGFPALSNVQVLLFAREEDNALPIARLADEIADGASEPAVG